MGWSPEEVAHRGWSQGCCALGNRAPNRGALPQASRAKATLSGPGLRVVGLLTSLHPHPWAWNGVLPAGEGNLIRGPAVLLM